MHKTLFPTPALRIQFHVLLGQEYSGQLRIGLCRITRHQIGLALVLYAASRLLLIYLDFNFQEQESLMQLLAHIFRYPNHPL